MSGQTRDSVATRIPVKIQGNGIYQSPDTPVLEVAMVDLDGLQSQTYWNTISFAFDVNIRPGTVYTLQIAASYVEPFVATVFAPPGYSVYVGPTRTNSIESNNGAQFYDITSGWGPYGATNVYSCYLVVVPTHQQTSLAVATATSLRTSRIFWELGLGNLSGGRGAGRLALVDRGDAGAWGSLYAPTSLLYLPDSEYNAYGYLTPNSDDSIQIPTAQSVVDIEPVTSTSYNLRFFTPAQASWGYHGGVWKMGFSGAAFASFLVEKGSGASDLVITKTLRDNDAVTNPSATVVQTLKTQITRSGNDWTLVDWYNPAQSPVSVSTWTDTVTGSTRTAVVTTRYGSGGSVSSVNKYTFYQYPWGEELTEQIRGFGSGQPNLVTSFDYETSTSDLAQYGMLKSVVYPDGRWKAFKYAAYQWVNGFGHQWWTPWGLMSTTYGPWAGSSTSLPGTLSPSVGDVTSYSYETSGPSGHFGQPKGFVRSVDGQVVGQQAISYSDTTLNSLPVTVVTQVDSTTTSSTLTTKIKYYTGDVYDTFISGKTVSIEKPDQTKDTYCYEFGAWSSGSFTYNSGLFNTNGTATRVTVYHGTTKSSGNTLFTGESGAPSVDSVYLVSGKSTKEVTIQDAFGRTVRTSIAVFSSGNFYEVTATTYNYDLAGRLTGRSRSNGTSYAATYTGDFLASVTTEGGVTTDYTADAAYRPATAVTDGEGAVGNLTVAYTYDGSGRTLQREVGTSEKLTSVWTYDSAGRVTSETLPGLSAKSYSYTSGGRVVTTTYPNTSTEIRTYLDDGQLSSITGTGVLPIFFTYTPQSDGEIWIRTSYAVVAPPGTSFVDTNLDMLGRKTWEARIAYNSAFRIEIYQYHASTGLLVKTSA